MLASRTPHHGKLSITPSAVLPVSLRSPADPCSPRMRIYLYTKAGSRAAPVISPHRFGNSPARQAHGLRRRRSPTRTTTYRTGIPEEGVWIYLGGAMGSRWAVLGYSLMTPGFQAAALGTIRAMSSLLRSTCRTSTEPLQHCRAKRRG